MFATSRCPSAYEAYAVTTLGEHDRKEAISLGMAQQDHSLLTDRMARIIDHDAEGVAESCGGLIESDTMLTLVPNRLLRIPLESEGH